MVRSALNHFRRRDSAVGEGGGEKTAAAMATVRAMFGGLYRLNPAGAADLVKDLLLDSVEEAEEAMAGGDGRRSAASVDLTGSTCPPGPTGPAGRCSRSCTPHLSPA